LFKDNADRFSLCYHGNDHTQSEFASPDTTFLNAALTIAEKRMGLQQQATGLHCDKVMVFPGSDFSTEAMQVLKSRNFYAAVSSAWHPLTEPSLPSLGDMCRPAVLRFGGFPLFGRNTARDIRSQDVAFNLFFGRPTFTGEHHDTFENPNYLVEGVDRINAVSRDIVWSNLETAVSKSFLRRRSEDGTVHIQAYSSTVAIANNSESVERYCVEWDRQDQSAAFEQVLCERTACPKVDVKDEGISAVTELAPHTLKQFSAVFRNPDMTLGSLGIGWDTKAFVRRRLSEVRDNYLSRNRHVLRLAKSAKSLLTN
jgi:hypothetical protein